MVELAQADANTATTGDSSLPEPLKSAYADLLAEAIKSGLDESAAKRMAWRKIQLAGWYRTSSGWKRLAPDVLESVNIRQALQQPGDNGDYIIEDVDVFYPNAAKGADAVYSPEVISRIIANTNRSIESGAQKPPLTLVHSNQLTRAMGSEEQNQGHGKAVNFRPSTRGEGWLACDLIDVESGMVRDFESGRITGLSVEFIGDAGDLNIRVGSVAALGAQMQALSYLPALEIVGVRDQACFAASKKFFAANPIPQRSTTMPEEKSAVDPKHAELKTAHTEMARTHDTMAAAHAAHEAGEQGADAKLKEAETAFAACLAKHKGKFCSYAAEPEKKTTDGAVHADEAQEKAMLEKMLGGKTSNAADTIAPTELGGKALADTGAPAATAVIPKVDAAAFAALPVDKKFAAMWEHIETLTNAATGFAAENTQLKTGVARLLQERVNDQKADQKRQFQAKIADLQSKGHQFDAGAALEMYDQVADRAKGVIALLKQLESSPKKISLAGAGQMFSADASNPTDTRDSATIGAEALRLGQSLLPGVVLDPKLFGIGAAVSK